MTTRNPLPSGHIRRAWQGAAAVVRHAWHLGLDHPRAAVSALVLAAALLRAWRLDSMSIWQDEGLSLYRATKPLAFILSGRIDIGDLATRDVQPPLYFLLLAGWFQLLGVGTWLAKYLSLAAGLPSIPLVWALGRRWAGNAVGLTAAALLAISPVLLWYSQEIRSYTLQVTLALLAVYCLVRALEAGARDRPPAASGRREVSPEATGTRTMRIAWLSGSVVANAALVWVHYLGFLLVAFEGLYVLLAVVHDRRERGPHAGGASGRRVAALAAIAAAATGVAALPLVPFAVRRLGIGAETDQQFVPLPVILEDVVHGLTFGWDPRPERVWWIDLIVAALLLIGLAWLWRRRRDAAIGLALFLLVPVLGLFAITLVKPVYMGMRHILLASPAFFILVSAGIVALARRSAFVGIAAGSLVAGGMLVSSYGFYHDPAYLKDDLRGLAAYVDEHSLPGDVLAVSDPRLVLTFEHLVHTVPVVALPDMQPTGLLDASPPSQLLGPLLASARRLWFMTPHPAFKDWLEDPAHPHARLVDQRYFVGRTIPVRLDAYERRPWTWGQIATWRRAEGEDEVQWMPDPDHSAGALEEIEPGRSMRVYLRWPRADYAPPKTKLALRLVGADGRTYGQADHDLLRPGPLDLAPYDLPVSPAAPPGTYTVTALAYDPATGSTLPSEGPLSLGEVIVGVPADPVPSRRVPVAERSAAEGGGLAILGYDLGSSMFPAGASVNLAAWLRATGAAPEADAVRVELVDRLGRTVAAAESRLGTDTDPVQGWRAGDVRRVPVDLDLPARPGTYGLRLALLRGEAAIWLRRGLVPVRRVWLRPVTVEPPTREAAVAAPANVIDATFGDSTRLAGFDGAVELGATVPVTLHWRSLAPVGANYQVTVQLVPAQRSPSGVLVPSGPPVAQHDGAPSGGARPVRGWRPGETVLDRHDLEITRAAEGDALLIVALYDPARPGAPRVPVTQDGAERDYAVLREIHSDVFSPPGLRDAPAAAEATP